MSEPNGWHNFTLEQAKEYIADVKKDAPRNWTGLGRVAEQMTELADQLSQQLAALTSDEAVERALVSWYEEPTLQNKAWKLRKMRAALAAARGDKP